VTRNDDGPRAAQREDRPGVQIAAPAKDIGISVRRGAVTGRRRRAARRREAITARVSLLAPGGRRTLWHYLATCPVCGAPHLGRARELANVTTTRRLPCKHWVTVVIARTYGNGTAA
jgi:hypothetical protein